MNDKLKKAILGLHISAILYLFLILSVYFFPKLLFKEGDNFRYFMIIILTITMILIELVIYGLKNNKKVAYWGAWVFCFLYIPSIFILFGIWLFKALMDTEIRNQFNIKK